MRVFACIHDRIFGCVWDPGFVAGVKCRSHLYGLRSTARAARMPPVHDASRGDTEMPDSIGYLRHQRDRAHHATKSVAKVPRCPPASLPWVTMASTPDLANPDRFVDSGRRPVVLFERSPNRCVGYPQWSAGMTGLTAQSTETPTVFHIDRRIER